MHQTDAAPAAQLRKLLGGDFYSAALPEGIVSAKRATGMRASQHSALKPLECRETAFIHAA